MNWWNKISNIGIVEELSNAEKMRGKLTNRFLFIALWIEAAYIPLFIHFNLMSVLIGIIVIIAISISLFYFSKKRKHHLAAIFLSALLISYVAVSSILTPGANTELYLIPMSLLGFVMVRNIKVGVCLFLYAVLGFFMALYGRTIITPLATLPEGVFGYVYIFNIVLIFFSCFYLIYHFKLSNDDYENDILTQKEKIENQHSQLEENLQEIKDSINYAKRIQKAILPSGKAIKESLPESFVLYKPKDIVAGDFYWLEEKEGNVLFAAADCTGHGVPGAMVSVICNNGLNRSVREYGLEKPGDILNKTREIVIQEFEKSEDDVKDGMDVALCSLKFLNSSLKESNLTSEKQETVALLQYSGANNPLWIVREGELIETKADKQPIGKFSNPSPYTTHEFNLQKGDSLYVFTDGFIDQFGGPKGKKLKAKAFKRLLLEVQNHSMNEQEKLINEAFENWRGNLEQIDDVCVIGVKI